MKKWLFPILLFLIFLLCPRVEAAELPFQDGDRIVIWAASEGKALSATRSGNYPQAVSVTLEGDTLTGFSGTEIWTVTYADGGWQFSNNGQYLSMANSYSYLHLGEVHDTWSLEAAGADTFTFTNQGRSQLICLNSRRGQWNACTAAAAARSGVTELSVFVLPREEPGEEPGLKLYFGQLHGHSNISDGGESPETLYAAAKAAGLDFYAITDHSHSFDNAEAATLSDGSSSELWAGGKALAEQAAGDDFLPLFAFEMAWNQGQGHISTFFTPGFLSREREEYRSYAEGLENYYAALEEIDGSISQFNHADLETRNFKSYASHSAALDSRISLMEVAEDLTPYFQALAAGWHPAPTLSGEIRSISPQDTARTVVLAQSLREADFQAALAARRVYATTDADLSIRFSLDGQEMGSILQRSQLGSTVTLTAALSDPTDAAIGNLEILSAYGEVLVSAQADTNSAEITFTLNANRDFYLLRVTQPDGDWAVTAPIWLDDRDDLGIAALEPGTALTTAGQSQTLTVSLYNDENMDYQVTDVTLSIEGAAYRSAEELTIAPGEAAEITFSHLFPVDGVYTVTARVTGSLDGVARQHTFSREVTVMPPALVEDVALDLGHGCEDPMDAMAQIAAARDADVQTLTLPATAKQLEDCRLLVIPAPEVDFSPEFSEAVRNFVQNGGSLILCGTGVSQNADAADRLNALLEAIGASGRFCADDARDETSNAGSPEQLRATDFSVSLWTETLSEGQFFAQNYGCTLDAGAGQWLVRGFASTGSPVLLSVEQTAFGGDIFLSGGNFLAEDALLRPQPSENTLPYANQTLFEAILDRIPQQTTPIAQLRESEIGRIYRVEGRITAGTANPNTTFPDTVYLQDDTGGIAARGYSTHGLALGTRVRILGALTEDGENPTLRILRLTELETDTPIQPRTVSGTPDYAASGGSLLAVEGIAGDILSDGTAVSRFTLSGVTVVVEDAIRSGSRGVNELARIVREGNLLRAVGLLHRADGQTVLRLRDCDEVWLLEGQSEENLPTQPDSEEDSGDSEETDPTDPGQDSTDPSDPADPDAENPPTGDRIGIFVLLLILSPLSLLPVLHKTGYQSAP